MDQQEIKIKLLTLLNVVAAKPNINNNDTDWLEIARRTIKTKQSIQQKQQQEQEEEEELEQSTEQQEEVDSYHYHFGPQTTIINPNSIKLAQQEDAWKLTSNQKTKDDRRIVNFQLDSTITCPKLTPKIHKSLQSTLQKFNHNENRFFSSINQYQDVWFTGLPYDHNRDHSRTATSLWALQHILKTRNEILKNNEYLNSLNPSTKAKLSIDEVKEKKKEEEEVTPIPEREIRDQGYTRAKVLILLPFRSTALTWLKTLIKISGYTTIKGLERFEKEYNLPEGTIDKLASEDAHLKYPLDHRIIFQGNIDDDFFLPVKFNRKEIRLYSDIFSADLIIGSPVGLRKFIEKEGDADFLSSIEISIVDQMDVIQMQNWEHVEFIFEHLNQIPKKLRDTDFSRIKPWYLDSHSQHIRQTILYSSQISAEQTCLFRRNLKNIRGKQIEFGNVKEISQGVLWKIRKGLKQTWLSFDSSSSGNDPDQSRLDFFRNKILDPLLSSALVKEGLAGILIFFPNYFDYIRLINLFRSIEDIKFASISEYSSTSEISAARSSFFNKHVSFLLVTERFHFFNRFKIRGAQQIIFYSPPYNPQFYTEFVNVFPFLTSTNLDRKSARDQDQDLKIVDVNDLSVFVLFNKLDLPQIERIIGLEHTRKIVKSIQSDPTGSNNSFTFL
ncbi:hypothetical protein MJO29_004364 [Puccinia striiformis f. sp. tritici]|nr:hypothetical protein MJO29_004364 [Puccinia striiformis f. sp. tritici]KAI9627096.1 hypothetical protein KEM48_010005 [Puccinia striiformis f. sp. tritici PST-130]